MESSDLARRAPAAHRHGLSAREAHRRLATHGPNELPPPPREWIVRRIMRSLRDPLVLLLLAAAAVAGLGLGEQADALAIGTIVIINTVIGVIEEGRATHALDALRAMEAPQATVVRDGHRAVIAARDLVPGDLVLAEAGGRVPADMTVDEAASLEVDESILTGESLPIARAVDDALSAGTYISRGTVAGVVTATGTDTALGQIAQHLRDERPATPLQRELARVAGRLGIAAVVIALAVGAIVFVRLGASLDSFEEALLVGVALAVAAVPEGLATVVTIALALGVRRMAKDGAIIRRLQAVETLGSTTVIATDKTGTLTENTMRLTGLVLGGSEPTAPLPPAVRERAARAAVLCNDATGDPPVGDPVDVALRASEPAHERTRLERAHPRLDAIPFEAERRRMTTLHEGGLVLVKGAPETVLDLCARMAGPDGSSAPLDDAARTRILEQAAAMAGSGMRVLALADGTAADSVVLTEAEHDLTFLVLAGMRDPTRAEAPHAVAEARAAGVRVVMVTGDHPGTARAIATEVGIDPDDVHARVDPEQKLELVRGLRAHGEIVAVTGDGVNDAPALRHADIGVAMGRTGSDVAREAGDMVITDDNLATIVTAIRQGRGIFDNVRKVVDYLVAGNLAEIFVVVLLLAALPALGIPLTPLQLLWINLVTDGLPALALGVDPIDATVMQRPPRASSTRLLSARRVRTLSFRGALIAGAAIGGLAAGRLVWSMSWDDARGVMFTVLVVAQVLYAFAVRHRPGGKMFANTSLIGAAAAGITLQVIVTAWAPARTLFDATALTPAQWLFVAAAGIVPVAAIMAWGRRHR